MCQFRDFLFAAVRDQSAAAFVRSVGHFNLVAFDASSQEPKANFGEIFWCVDGRGWFGMNGRRQILRPGYVWYYPPGSSHNFGPDEKNFHYRWLTVEGRCASGLFDAAGMTPGLNFGGDCPDELFAGIEMGIVHTSRPERVKILTLAFEILARACSGLRKSERGNSGDRAAAAGRIISTNFSDPDFNVARLADILHSSRVVLSRDFKCRYGITLSEYIHSLRLKKALEMLRSGSPGIADVAHQCGFSSAAYFTKIIFAATGMTPTLFRNS